MSAPRTPSRTCLTRGSVYIAVLAVSALVVVIGMAGIASSRAMARAGTEERNLSSARWAAASGIEVGRYIIQQDGQWRSHRGNGNWLTDAPCGEATFTLSAQNPNGAMNRSPYDPVILTCLAKVGAARHAVSVTLQPDFQRYNCLDVSMAIGGLATLNGNGIYATGNIVACNATITAVACSVNADVEATVAALGASYNGTVTNLVPARTLPGADAFDFYVARGTSIPIGSLPSSSGNRQLERLVLSPASNPIAGGTNPAGIYVIDCANSPIQVQNCRIVGTLVLLNPGTGSVVQNSVVFEPAIANLPCLLVSGNISIRTASSNLVEGSNGIGNLNPAGTPYPFANGNSDSDTSDSYPCIIDGLVYVSGDLGTSGTVNTDMIIVGGAYTQGGNLFLSYDSTYKRTPPPGFATVYTRPVRGTWTQVLP